MKVARIVNGHERQGSTLSKGATMDLLEDHVLLDRDEQLKLPQLREPETSQVW